VTDPLRLNFEVACPLRHAFEVWTRDIGRWWPADHSVSGERGLQVVLEPGVGGRIYERTPAGTEHEWGEVTVWEPPSRLGYLWHLRRDRADATDVEIRFVADGPGLTRVEIVHSGWDRLGAAAQEWRDRNHGGWTTLLPHYRAAAGRQAGRQADRQADRQERR
jgi:Activator of Hsp90 ATPase homolog 1-like protein